MKVWQDYFFIYRSINTINFFLFVIIINYYAAYYATTNAGPMIPDLILDNIPFMDMSYVHYYFSGFLKLLVLVYIFLVPKYFNFVLKSVSLLILVRSFFIVLTHLGIPGENIPVSNFFTMGGDLFFSGHVAIPFLLGLIYWENKLLRNLAFSISFIFALEVLFGKLHYSIDVFAAPFFAFTIYHIALRIFKSDFDLLKK